MAETLERPRGGTSRAGRPRPSTRRALASSASTRFDSRLNSFVALDRRRRARRSAGERRASSRAARRARALDGHSDLDQGQHPRRGHCRRPGAAGRLQDFRPANDELPVARLRAAGMIVIGKTNVPEFTLEGYTRNDLFGVTRNPWNPRSDARRLERRRGGKRRGRACPRARSARTAAARSAAPPATPASSASSRRSAAGRASTGFRRSSPISRPSER